MEQTLSTGRLEPAILLGNRVAESLNSIPRHSADFDRVRANTSPEVNRRLDARAAARVQSAAKQGSDLSRGIAKLERERNFDRVLEAESSVLALTGLALGAAAHRAFFLLPGFVAVMVLLHGTHGWYPLLPLFRRLGVRTQDEIDREKYALKALRGDFALSSESEASSGRARAAAAWRAVCA